MLRTGLIGFGRIAELFHLRALRDCPEAEISAIAEADESRRRRAKSQAPGARLFADYRDLLASDAVDAVVICLPPALHKSCAVDAFVSGRHVYLEKPIARDLDEAEAVCHAWRSSGRTGMIGFNFRFNKLYREMHALVASGTVGKLVGARSVFSAAARTVPAWKRDREAGGGVLLDLASHHVDAARFVFQDEVAAARASVESVRFPGDTATLELRMSSGLVMQSFFSMSAIEEHRFEVYGVRGKLSFERVASDRVEVTRPLMAYDNIRRIWDAAAALRPRRLLRSPSEPSFTAALQAFVQAASAGRQVKPDLEDGFRSLSAVLAAEASARESVWLPPATAAAQG